MPPEIVGRPAAVITPLTIVFSSLEISDSLAALLHFSEKSMSEYSPELQIALASMLIFSKLTESLDKPAQRLDTVHK